MHLHVLWDSLKSSRLIQAGTLLIILSGLAEALDQVGALDITSVPYLGNYAPAIFATAGALKIIIRLAMFLISGLAAK